MKDQPGSKHLQVKRVLLVMIQPPGCSGVQALIYNKLLPYLENYGWEFHFAGPAPWLFSVLTERLDYPQERLHYTTNVSSSLRFSVEKNRHPKKSLPYLFYGCLQLLSRVAEKIRRHDSHSFLLRGLEKTVRQAEDQWHFDVIAGKSPDFNVLSLVGAITQSLNKPFLALMDDPYGARDEHGFYPKSPELQRQLLGRSCATLFMSPLTRERYVQAGLVANDKAHALTDSYPESPDLYRANRSILAANPAGSKRAAAGRLNLIYLGMLPEWRPIEPFLEAMRALAPQADESSPFALWIFGYVYPAARQRIQSDSCLAEAIHLQPMVSYGESHLLAEDADLQLVVIGPRHLDNYPSKFFEYLGHHKPILVLGPPQNPLKQIVDDLQIGLYVDGSNQTEIRDALMTLRSRYPTFQDAYRRHAPAIQAFSAQRVARQLCQHLDGAMSRVSA